jgi:hypothetical protein
LLFRRLWNSSIECAFLPSPSESISLLSVDALDCVLSDGCFSFDSADALCEMIVGLGSDYFLLLPHVRWDFLSPALLCAVGTVQPTEPAWLWISCLLPSVLSRPSSIPLDSLIVADLPVSTEFRGKSFKLLWRGSRNGFRASDFHDRCDGHAPTLTLIQDSGGNIFGGFTLVEWDSSDEAKADPSQKSFLFTLKNPHNFPAKIFALMAEKTDRAIRCDSSYGSHFRDLCLSDNCNANPGSFLGRSYANDTDLQGTTVLTGSLHFTVKEVEVFEVTG